MIDIYVFPTWFLADVWHHVVTGTPAIVIEWWMQYADAERRWGYFDGRQYHLRNVAGTGTLPIACLEITIVSNLFVTA